MESVLTKRRRHFRRWPNSGNSIFASLANNTGPRNSTSSYVRDFRFWALAFLDSDFRNLDSTQFLRTAHCTHCKYMPTQSWFSKCNHFVWFSGQFWSIPIHKTRCDPVAMMRINGKSQKRSKHTVRWKMNECSGPVNSVYELIWSGDSDSLKIFQSIYFNFMQWTRLKFRCSGYATTHAYSTTHTQTQFPLYAKFWKVKSAK